MAIVCHQLADMITLPTFGSPVVRPRACPRFGRARSIVCSSRLAVVMRLSEHQAHRCARRLEVLRHSRWRLREPRCRGSTSAQEQERRREAVGRHFARIGRNGCGIERLSGQFVRSCAHACGIWWYRHQSEFPRRLRRLSQRKPLAEVTVRRLVDTRRTPQHRCSSYRPGPQSLILSMPTSSDAPYLVSHWHTAAFATYFVVLSSRDRTGTIPGASPEY